MSWPSPRIIRNLLIFALPLFMISCSEEGGRRKIEKTDLVILYSSDLNGLIRSCGCAVEDMGGLGRMATFIERTKSSEKNVIALSAGDDFSAKLSFSRKEADLIMDCYRLMGLDAMTPGELEFIFGVDYLKDAATLASLPLLASNLFNADGSGRLFEPCYIIKEFDTGLRVGVTGVIDENIKFPGYIDSSSFRLEPAAETLQEIADSLRGRADFLVLLSHMGIDGTRRVLEKVQDFDVAVVGHKRPKIDKIEKVGETLLLGTGGQGKYMGRLRLSFDENGEVEFSKFSLVPLTKKIRIHPAVIDIFNDYGIEITDKEAEKKNRAWQK